MINFFTDGVKRGRSSLKCNEGCSDRWHCPLLVFGRFCNLLIKSELKIEKTT